MLVLGLGLVKLYDRTDYNYVGPRGFLEETRQERERKKRREKTSGSGRCESHYHATIGVNHHYEID